MRKTERNLEFNFYSALSVDRPEVVAQPFKCADFVVQEADSTWIIEVTDATKASQEELKLAISQLLGQVKSKTLQKDLLMKLYGTHAHLAQINFQPNSKVIFGAVIGLPEAKLSAAQRNIIRDEMMRITRKVGPSFHGLTNIPVIKVESINSWNRSNPTIQIRPIET